MAKYKCTVCETEFDIKPQYCDCGNDVFEEVIETIPLLNDTPSTQDDIPVLSGEISQYSEPIPALDTEDDYYTPISRKKANPKTMIIFSICLILSLIILLFPINKDKDKIQNTKNQTEKTKLTKNLNIPDINKIWDNTPPKQIIEQKPQVVEQPKETVVQQSVQRAVQPQQQIQQEPQRQGYQPKVKLPENYKPVKRDFTTNTTPTQTQTQKIAKTNTNVTKSANQKPTTVQKPVQTPVKQNTTTQTQVNASQNQNYQSQQKAQALAQLKAERKELLNYKIALRQALFNNLSVTSIEGSGSCGISFNIDSSGKLTNRAFSFKSNNKSINDEIYKMMMKMPQYSPPPVGYHGEKINLVFEFNNGKYVINYTN